MSKRIEKFIKVTFYLLVFFLPLGLYKTFYPKEFLRQSEITTYLIPKLYLTDFFLIPLGLTLISTVKKVSRPRPSMLRALTLFYGTLLVSSMSSGIKVISLYYFLRFLSFGVFFVFLKSKVDRESYLKPLVYILSLSLLLESLLAVLQFLKQSYIFGFFPLGEPLFSASSLRAPLVSIFGLWKLRSFGTFPHPNVLGGFSSVILLWLLDLFLRVRKEERLKHYYLILVLVLGGLALVLSFSQAAWGSLIIGLAIYFLARIFQHRKINLKNVCLFILLSGILLSLLWLIGHLRLESFNTRRIDLEAEALKIFRSSPWFGIGMGRFTAVSSYSWREPVHNIFLLLLAETGLFGFIPFSIFLTLSLRRAFFLVSGRTPLFLASLVQLIFLGLFDHYLITSQQGGLLFWLVAGLLWAR